VDRQALAEINGAAMGGSARAQIGDLPSCRVDPALLKQVLVNLLSNAFKFSRDRQDPVVEVGWRRDLDAETHHTLFIKDNGVGFDMRYADKLFGVFQRLHSAEKFEAAGGVPRSVLLDRKRPKIDGIELLRRSKGDPRTQKIPVVMLTSSHEDHDLQACYELGVNSYIVKPVDFQQFTDAVRSLGLYWMLLNRLPS